MYSLDDELKRVSERLTLNDDWTILSLALPKSFVPVFLRCLNRYKALLNSDKDFPALEAMVVEALNSLPDEMEGNDGQSWKKEVDSHS